jgi:hypothetical protein
MMLKLSVAYIRSSSLFLSNTLQISTISSAQHNAQANRNNIHSSSFRLLHPRKAYACHSCHRLRCHYGYGPCQNATLRRYGPCQNAILLRYGPCQNATLRRYGPYQNAILLRYGPCQNSTLLRKVPAGPALDPNLARRKCVEKIVGGEVPKFNRHDFQKEKTKRKTHHY